MPDDEFRFASAVDEMSIQAYVWRLGAPKAVMVIAHGAAEHALRYERFARAANVRGVDVWAADHRGHGRTAGLDQLGEYGEGGWDALVADVGQLIGIARAEHPRLPVVLVGHSMGSIAAQQLAPEVSRSIAALILSGSTAREAPRESDPPPSLSARFEPARTAFDWLSRDEAEVDKYVADPFCGFDMRPMRRPGQRADAALLGDPERLGRIRPDLPCLFVAGDADPINRDMAGLRVLESWWRAAGVRRIDTLYYAGGRHEMLNETNRDEVTRDILDWVLDAVSASGA
jgi:alpha-beta hydrolase superfamily lysophospholipase